MHLIIKKSKIRWMIGIRTNDNIDAFFSNFIGLFFTMIVIVVDVVVSDGIDIVVVVVTIWSLILQRN